ncbi:type I polyketide synthase [Kitasatospora sp. LaBMicrA B282]|uniref:type I polyketide synthase n=1 Tax=Kitasatospora sp. LaBMicrA B282 TaxID=3420949 RepID=UPI003D0C3293
MIRGSAVNQDGASNGLTAPNGPAQQRVIRAALAQAGLGSDQVDLVEAHGTGTRLGDPIEAQALLATYGRERPADRPLWLGSLKSNIGHTQAAAGVGGIIKTVQAIRHGLLPKTLHVDQPTPHVDWASGAVELLTEARPWPRTDRPRRAAVSSFGISGTNAHVIVEQAPEALATTPVAPAPLPAGEVLPWLLSARSADGLRAQARQLADHLTAQTELSAADLGRSLATGRAAFEHRAAVVAADLDAFRTGLRALAAGEPVEHVVTGAARSARKPVFVFPGQGAQWVGMAVELAQVSPVFAERLAECDRALSPFVPWSLFEVLDDEAALGRVDVVQPALWAVMVSLAALWRSFGVEPAAVVGHSQGEIAAAVVAGGLSLADGARVVALRSRAIAERLSGRGGMAAVPLGAAEVEELLGAGRLGEDLSVAAVNGPRSVVVSGGVAALEELLDRVEGARRVPVDYASHSAQVATIEDELAQLLAGLDPVEVDVPFLSTVTGEWLAGPELDGGYWYRNLRRTVRFADAAAELARQDHAFIEVSPHPVLAPGLDAPASGTLRRGDGGALRFMSALAEAYVRGVAVDWDRVYPGADRVELPTYPFQRERYWLAGGTAPGDVAAAGVEAVGHPLLGAAVPLAGSAGTVLTGRLSLRSHGWLADHAVHGTVLLPGTAFVELALQAGRQTGCQRIEELTLETPLVLPASGAVQLQLSLDPADPRGRRALAVYARTGEGEWVRHAAGTLAPAPAPTVAGDKSWPPVGAEPLELGDFYQGLADAGLAYGPAFRGLRAAWRRGAEVFAEVRLDGDGAAAGRFGVHPALLDAALHAIGLGSFLDGDGVRLPFAWTGVSLHQAGAATLRVAIAPAGPDAVALTARDESGALVASVDSLLLRPLAVDQLAIRDALFRVEWREVGVVGGGVIGGGGVVGDVEVVEVDVSGGVLGVLGGVLGVVRRVLAGGGRVVFVTRGAVGFGLVGGPDAVGAAVWGLVRSAQSEHPGRFGLVDVECGVVVDAGVVAGVGVESQVVVRGGGVFVPRLVRVAVGSGGGGVFCSGGTVVVTGGLGVLGRAVARHVVGVLGVRRVLLVSRRVDAGVVDEVRGELVGLGAEWVGVASCDVGDRAALAGVLAGVEGRLVGVVHAAGVLGDGVVEGLTEETLARVLRAKVEGLVNLHELTAGLDLEVFVVFSSASGVLGAPGQGAYAAANAFVDAFVEWRRAQGLAGLSLAWGLWAERSGMTAGLDVVGVERIARGGMVGLGTAEGLALFDAARGVGDAVLVPMRLDLPALRTQAREEGLPPLLAELVPVAPEPVARGAAPAVDPTDPLTLVRVQAAAVLGYPGAEQVDPELRFLELGFDSLTSVRLRNRLNTATGLTLGAMAVFDHPTPRLLAEHLRAELAGRQQPVAAAEPGNTIGALYRQACADGKVVAATDLLMVAASLRPAFAATAVGQEQPLLDPVRLADGPAQPELICLPSLTAMSSPHQYARFAAGFGRRRRVSALALPGYLAGERLPSSATALVELVARSVLRATDGAPFALAGYSSGGWPAHEVAARLAELGHPATGLVLLDTFLPADAAAPAFRARMVRAMFEREEEFGWTTEDRLTAMGGYFAHFHGWTPAAGQAPTLLVRAERSLTGEHHAAWPLPHTAVTVGGDHFTMLETEAGTAAGAVDDWLRRLRPALRPGGAVAA